MTHCFKLLPWCFWFGLNLTLNGSEAYISHRSATTKIGFIISKTDVASVRKTMLQMAKRNKKQQSKQDTGDMDKWYEDINENASPDEVYWKEMERQNQQNDAQTQQQQQQYPSVPTPLESQSMRNVRSMSPGPSTESSSYSSMYYKASLGGGGGGGGIYDETIPPSAMNSAMYGSTPIMDKKAIDATLKEYERFMVKDNWLDERKIAMMNGVDNDFWNDNADELDKQLDEWEKEDGDIDKDWDIGVDDPWDHWGEDDDKYRADGFRKLHDPDKDSEFSLYNTGENEEEQEKLIREQEEKFVTRISQITIQSDKLRRARNNPRAKAFFKRKPNSRQGYDQMWVSATSDSCFMSLKGRFETYGIEFADNFDDWADGSIDDESRYSIEDIASFKARQVYNATGLPCIALRTSFEIEPETSDSSDNNIPGPGQGAAAKAVYSNPRALSGYRFKDVGLHVDYICEALRVVSEPTRVTRFESCLCYYDGELEIFDYGACECDLHFANLKRAVLPAAQALCKMTETLELTFGLEPEKWLKSVYDEAGSVPSSTINTNDGETVTAASSYKPGSAIVKLRDRVLKEGKLLPNDIIDVSTFMDSMVDVDLMDKCALELSNRFSELRPTKILTVGASGLVIALPMAKYLQIPVVYARKERNAVMADSYSATYSSTTTGKDVSLLISKSHVGEKDRILIIDDFLSSGKSQEALLRIVSEAGAEPVGIGVLLEKTYLSGRIGLSGFDIPIHSICRVASVKDGIIQLVEEDGFDRLQS